MDAATKTQIVIAGLTTFYVATTLYIAYLTRRSIRETQSAFREQIEASEKQNNEMLYNQHKPVLIPWLYQGEWGKGTHIMGINNKGAGVASNTWGILTTSQSKQKHYAEHTGFMVPDTVDTQINFLAAVNVNFPPNYFEGYSVYPSNGVDIRILLTYNDAFGNKYLVVFDQAPILGWIQVGGIKKINQRLDELVERKGNKQFTS